jgi:hypothetical protein
MADFIIQKGTTRPILNSTLTYSDGSTVNLTGATVKFVMRPVTATAPTTSAGATITSATSPATVQYTFTAVDTQSAGQFQAQWAVTFGDGSTMNFPTDGYLEVSVTEDLTTPTPVGRIVGLGDVKDHLNITGSDRTHDAELLRFMDAVTPIVEGLVGDVIQRSRSERYDGGWSYITLRHRPVVSVESCVEYRGPVAYTLQQVSNPALGTIYSYTFEGSGRIVRRTVGGGVVSFPSGPNAIDVTYTSGFASVPANIKFGTLELIRVNYQQTQQGGRPQFGSGSGLADDFVSGAAMGFFIPNRVREIFASSRRHPSVA